ncbi:MAG: hypothetical protein K8H88_19845, partial [Sandaracinaceae bacterium]|nr:hypothetical protein [Sandaracinaceae bacterium]
AIAISKPEALVLAMVKPQFEVGREHLHKGVVRDAAARQDAIDRVSHDARTLGLVETGRSDSVLAGPDGNLEAFLLFKKTEAAHESGLS